MNNDVDVVHKIHLATSSESGSSTDWYHVDLLNMDALRWLENESGLDPAVIDALSAEETRPRSFKTKNGIMVILRGVNMNPGHDPEDMVSIRVWIEADRVVTVRRRPVISVQDLMSDIENDDGPSSSGGFLVELVNKLANRIGDFVEKLDEELEQTEQGMEEIETSQMRTTLGLLRKQIATVRRYLSPQRDALDRLNHVESPLFSERDRIRLREESDRVSRYLEDLDLARERAIVVHEAFLAQIAQQQNNRMYALSIITTIFLPLGFITGLLGINVGGMPGADSDMSFWLVCGGLTVIAVLIAIAFKRMRWL